MIKIYFFQEDLKNKINNINRNSLYLNGNIDNIILINNKIIKIYKEYFNYNELFNILKSNITPLDFLKDDKSITNLVDKNRNILKEYISIIEQKNSGKITFDDISQYDIIEKTLSYQENKLKYINEFEIINNDIYSFFKTKKNFNNIKCINAKYITKNGKIIIYNLGYNLNFIEIGIINDDNDFIIEYLIKEVNKAGVIIDFINKYGINDIIKNDVSGKSDIKDPYYDLIGYCYKIKTNENIIDHVKNSIKYEDKKIIKAIVSIIVSFFKFNKELKNKIEISKNETKNVESKYCFLINKNFVLNFKKLFSFENFFDYNILNKSDYFDIEEDIYQKIINGNNIDQFLKNKEKLSDIFNKYEYSNYIKNNYKPGTDINVPSCFELIDENTYQKISSLNNNNEDKFKTIKKSNYGINKGKVILKINDEKYFEFQNLLYIFSVQFKNNEINNENIFYIPEMVLSFKLENQRINHFDLLCNGEDIRKYYPNQNSRIIIDSNSQYICKSYLLKNGLNNISENKNRNQEKLIKNISYIIIINEEYLTIQKEIQEYFKRKTDIQEEYYLISPLYVEEIEKLFHFNKICNLINNNRNLLNDNNFVEKVIDLINKNCGEQIVNDLNQLDERTISMKLIHKELYKLKVSEKQIGRNNVIKYFNNYKIINRQLFNLFKKIDINLNSSQSTFQLKRYILGEGKIIYLLNDKSIIVGNINEKSIFNSELLIFSDYSSFCPYIFDSIKKNGINYLETYIHNGKIIDKMYNNYYEAFIYNLLKNTDNCYFNISNKLKALIILSLYQLKLKTKNNGHEYKTQNEQAFLLNPKWLQKYEFDKIYNLIKNDEYIKNNIMNIHSRDLFDNNINYIDNLIIKTKLDKDLINIDQNISKISDSYEYKASESNIKLINNKKIVIYKEFIILDQSILSILQLNFNFESNIQYVKFLSYNNYDILEINNIPQYTFLFGNYNNQTNIFIIKYILDFEYSFYFEQELNLIKNNNIEKYINNRLIFNDNNNNDLISPIFGDNKIIGYGYKYKDSIKDYTSYFNYSELLSNKQLINILFLYCNEKILNYKFNQNKDIIQGKYYLISNNLINKIKIDNDYKQIKEVLDDNNKLNFMKINNFNNKIKLYLIKCLSMDLLNNFINSNDQNDNKYSNEIILPDIIKFDYFDNKQNPSNIFIYNNFSLINKNVIDVFIGQRYENENYLECIFTDNNVIINYPKSINTIQKYVSAIGNLDSENNFITKYLLIYDDEKERLLHINKLKNHLEYYLQKYFNDQQLINNSQPITGDNYKEIGTFVKYEPNNTINQNNNYINNNNQIENLKYENLNNEISTQYPKDNDKHFNDNNFHNKNNYFKIKDNVTPFIKDNFAYFPLIGLENIGATCYMNATIQCFCHIEKFVNFFKYSHQAINKSNENGKYLTYSFKLLIENLWPDNYDPSFYEKKYYTPIEFKNKISKMNNLFEGVAANDAKDLVNFIIMTLHEELNKANNNNINNNNIILDQTNQQVMFNNFAKSFMDNNKSIISDLFYGINCSITQCGGCGIQTYNYQTYFFLVFPLEEVRKFKYNNNFNYNINNNVVTIFDCFDYDKKINIMSGENSMFCNFCKRSNNSSMCTILTTGPEILILLLNRGKGIEFNVKINFTYELNLFNYIQYNNSGYNYKLIGVITHMGESGMGGHFIAYCCDPLFEKWYKYNDAIVSEVKDFQNEVINYAMPYLLFYQKK